MRRLTQYLAMVAGVTWVMLTGVNLGWPSPYLPVLESDKSPIGKISRTDAFWCSVMPLIGGIPGALLAATVVDKFGRKNILVGIAPISMLCFFAMAFTKNLWVLDAARFILGSTEGATYTVLPMYFGEIAEPSIRGALSSSITLGSILGLFVINVLGLFTTIFESSLIMGVVPFLHIFALMWLPKSPYFLIKVGRLKEAKKSLQRLRGDTDVNDEFTEIMAAVERQEADAPTASLTDLFTKPGNRKAIRIYLIIAMAKQFSGSSPITFYTQTIFDSADSILDPALSVMVFHLIGVISIVLATCAVDKFGRKPLMIGSIIGCALSLALMASYLTLRDTGIVKMEDFNWIPLVALISYYSIYNLGICIGSVVFLSELFPTSVKKYAFCVADCSSVVLGAIASIIFYITSESFGIKAPFWLFAAVCTASVVVIYFYVPETKGMTLEKIQLQLTGNKANTSPINQTSDLRN